jgi:hypothetical protein
LTPFLGISATLLWATVSTLSALETRTPLTSVGVVTTLDGAPDPDDPGVGGGFDSASYFTNVYSNTVASCTERINRSVDQWLADRKLMPQLRERSSSRLLVHAPAAKGFFEISYRFDVQQRRARVTLYFVGGDGAMHEPSGIMQLLTDYRIAELQEALQKAILCGAA